MEEIYENDICICILGDTPNTTPIIASDTPAIYNSNEYDNEYDNEYEYEYEYDNEYDKLLYLKSIWLDLKLDLRLPNVNGDTVIMYLSKKPFDDNEYDNDEYDFDRDKFINYLIADDKTDSEILNIRDANNQSLFEITLNNYLEVLTKSKRCTDHKVSRKDLKIKCLYERSLRIDRTDDENDRNATYNTNLEKRQEILLNRLKTIYSKLSVTLQNEIDEQYCDCKINFK